jgi:hypothetical protein
MIKTHNGGKIETCPLGTQQDECGEQPVYVEPAAPGGCHQTCDTSILQQFLHTGDDFLAFDPMTTCSDGGPGSVRIRFQMPMQYAPSKAGSSFDNGATNNFRPHYQQMLKGMRTRDAPMSSEDQLKYKVFQTTDRTWYATETQSATDANGEIFVHQGIGADEYDMVNDMQRYEYWDFACAYGSQCQACSPREENNHREIEDELAKPTGPLFLECDDADDAECCRKLATFPVSKDNYFDLRATQCADICLFDGRSGEDGACMPQDPECANWNTHEDWPVNTDGSSKTTSVQAWCLCGPVRTPIFEQSCLDCVVAFALCFDSL